MSHSGRRTSYEERQDQVRAAGAEENAFVLCRHLIFLHRTDKGGVLLQEDEDLGGPNGKKTWVPGVACRFHPPLGTLDKGDAVEVEMPKRLALEKEFLYEEKIP